MNHSYFEPEKRYFCSTVSARETYGEKKRCEILNRNLTENGWGEDKKRGCSLLGIVLRCVRVDAECGLSETVNAFLLPPHTMDCQVVEG